MSKVINKLKQFFGLQQTHLVEEMVRPTTTILNTGTQVLQSLKPHVPMIKFRGGASSHPSVSGGHSSAASGSSQTQTIKQISTGSIEDWELPSRYRRRPINPEEVAYINRGGPE